MTMIPMVFHFGFIRGNTNYSWSDTATLCLKSCLARACPERIVIHYDRPDEGPAWDEARALPKVEWKLRTPTTEINGIKVTYQALWKDQIALQVLFEEGGWFCDLDNIFLKSFEPLRHNPAVIGTQCSQKKKLNCAILGSVPGGRFITAYRDSYKNWGAKDEKIFWNFANNVPWALWKKDPDSVCVLKRAAFYQLGWSNKSFWHGKELILKNSFALHWWNALHPGTTVEVLLKTGLQEEIQKIIDPSLGKTVNAYATPIEVTFN
jgi:hypothetical protein